MPLYNLLGCKVSGIAVFSKNEVHHALLRVNCQNDKALKTETMIVDILRWRETGNHRDKLFLITFRLSHTI